MHSASAIHLITYFGSVEHLAIIPAFPDSAVYVQQQHRLDTELHDLGLCVDRLMVYWRIGFNVDLYILG